MAAFGTTAAIALGSASAAAEAPREGRALLVEAESPGVSVDDRQWAHGAVQAALEDAAVSYRVSPVSLEQLALALGCEPAVDACLVRIAREVANATLMVRKLESATDDQQGPRLTLLAVSPDDGRLYRTDLSARTTGPGGLLAAAPGTHAGGNGRTASGTRPRAVPARRAAEALTAEQSARATADPEPAQMTPIARTVGASAVAAAAVLVIAGTVEAVRAGRSDDRADAILGTSPQDVQDQQVFRDESDDHTRLARGVFATAGVLAVSGTLALLWHKFHANSDATHVSALRFQGGVVRGGALIAVGGQWGGSL